MAGKWDGPIFGIGLAFARDLAITGKRWAGQTGWVVGLVCGGLLSSPLLLMGGVMWLITRLLWLSGGQSA
jgi:hypothetical protein